VKLIKHSYRTLVRLSIVNRPQLNGVDHTNFSLSASIERQMWQEDGGL
jgi:hypothetical protein